MKYKRVFITTALILLLVSCGNDSVVNSTVDQESSTAEHTDARQDAGKLQVEESNNKQEQHNKTSVGQFSQDIGHLSGHELSGRIIDFSHEAFDQGFRAGFARGEPEYPVAELSDQLTAFEKHVTDSLQSQSEDQPTDSSYDAKELV